MKQIHVLNVVGARPNFMKVAPLFREYSKHADRIAATLLHTGQHYDDAMSQTFFSDLRLPKPDMYLGVGSGSHAEQTAKVMVGFEEVLLKEKPDLVLVVGDVNSTMACTIVAAKLNIKVAHVEAGLRSFDRTMPEEINRLVTDALADILLTTSRDADANLLREGVAPEKIFFVGNTMIDSLLSMRSMFNGASVRQRFSVPSRGYGFVTLHRPSNVDDKQTFSGICEALNEIQNKVPLVWPLHPRTRKMIETHELSAYVGAMRNLHLSEPLSYIESMALMGEAGFVLTDSGGIQEETTVLGIPCLTLRLNTERPVTISEGTNELVGTDPNVIVRKTLDIIQGRGKKGGIPALWDGRASERIVHVLLKTQTP